MTLMALGAFVAVVGACDLLRAHRDDLSVLRQLAIIGVGAVALAVLLAWTGDGSRGTVLLGLGLLVALATWVVASTAALRRGGGPGGAPLRALAFGGLGLGAVVSALGVGALEEWTVWPDRLAGTILARWPAYDVVVASGAVLLQLATANIVVRLLLDSVRSPSAGDEPAGGGRLLGPMERIFIVGLGAIGQTTAAAIIVAAKGLFRLPSLTGTASDSRAATEHFLIGTFASWLLGLVGVAMIYLA